MSINLDIKKKLIILSCQNSDVQYKKHDLKSFFFHKI